MADIDRFYEILEIEPGASLAEIKHAYRDLAFVWHPDRFANNVRLQQKAQERLTEINEAYEQLVLFLSQPELSSIEPELPPPPPAPVAETLNRRGSRKPGSRAGSKKSKISPKATSNSQKRSSTAKSKPPNAARSARVSQNYSNASSSSQQRVATQNYSKPFAKGEKRFATQHLRRARGHFPYKTQNDSMFPMGPLAIALASYALTGWILTKSDAQPWMWALICGTDWLWVAILVAEGSATPEVWLTALVLAGAVGGAIAGFQAGGMVTAVAWALVGAGLGAIATAEAESRVVASVLGVGAVVSVAALMAATGTGNWMRAVVEAVCWGIAGLISGLAAQVAVNSRGPAGLGGTIGLAVGATVGIFVGAGVEAVGEALAIAGSKAVYGAWAAIGVIAGVMARIVAGERSIGTTNGLYTFVLLISTSGLGLWLGTWLVGRFF